MRTLLVAVSLVLAPVTALAQPGPAPVSAPLTVPAVLQLLETSPERPIDYHASVALHVRMRIFPFIRMTLHGKSTYTHPGLYRFVFRGMPVVAKAFSDMKYDLGDPIRWPQRYEIAFTPESTPQHPVLRLVPKVRGLVKTLDVAVDPERGRILKATWSRFDGGVITLVQTYGPNLSGHAVVAKQDATIDLPRMKASLEADYADFDFTRPSTAASSSPSTAAAAALSP